MKRFSLSWLFVVFVVFGSAAGAHEIAPRSGDTLENAARQPAPDAPVETVSGSIHRLVIDDRVAGMTVTEYSLRLDDGRVLALRDAADRSFATGDRVQATGRRNGSALFVSGVRALAAATPRAALPRREVSGKLALLHVDYFDDRSEFIYEVHDANGDVTPLALPRIPEALDRGMRVTVSGETAPDGVGIVPDAIAIESLATAEPKAAALSANNKTLVILMTFTDSPAVPFTQAQVQSVFSGGAGSGSVTEFFSEASFGQQLLTPTITNWLSTNAATPAGCSYLTMATLGRTAATNAGYNVGSYQNLVYVFPRVSSCGWIGLGYVGTSGAWINGQNVTRYYAHELGHNFGLLHAASLSCNGVPIGGSCSASEYGDPFDTMGNVSGMHYNAPQKSRLGWIASGAVKTHTAGSANYVLNPIELGGGSLYAVKVQVAANRTYWLEYRQPIGFDSGLASYPNNGVQIRVASPLETLCGGCSASNDDTELLDMTPGTNTFTDATLLAGQRWTDTTYGVTFNVISANASGVTVNVSMGGSGTAATTTTVASSSNPSTAGSSVTFTASVTGSSPTGTVAFTDGGSAIGGCGAVTLTGSGNTRTAACSTGALSAGTHSVAAAYGGDAANGASASVTLSQVVNGSVSNPTVWVDDSLPAGAVTAANVDGWTWVSSSPAPFSGSKAHQSALASGMHQHYFSGATATMSVAVGDTLYAYVYLDASSPPSEVMLQWNDGTWEHRAYWGSNSIAFGTDGTVSRQYMGALPAAGQWVKLSVPASAVGLEGRVVNGMAFTLYNGRATWDQAGRSSASTGSSAVTWLDDGTPAGAVKVGDIDAWTWVSSSPAPFSGTLAHQSAVASGTHQHYFYSATATMSVAVGDTLYAYVYLDASNPPSEVMLQWNDGTWEHRAYWGSNSIAWGIDGTVSRKYMGALPAAGQWVKLSVPASAVGLEGRVVNGMAFTLFNGRATWDQAGKQ